MLGESEKGLRGSLARLQTCGLFKKVTQQGWLHCLCVSGERECLALDASLLDLLGVGAGGYFFGTFPSGKRVQDTIFKAKSWPQYKAPMLKLQALWKGQAAPFGCAYTCAIGDTVTQGVQLQF